MGAALIALNALESIPGLKWLKANRYFRVADVLNDRADLDSFYKSALFTESKSALAVVSGLSAEQINPASARDLAMAVLRQDSAERHKFLNLSELCIGMASSLSAVAAAVLFDSFKHAHNHRLVLTLLLATAAIFMLRQPRFFAISERVVFGQFLIKQHAGEKLNAANLQSTHEEA